MSPDLAAQLSGSLPYVFSILGIVVFVLSLVVSQQIGLDPNRIPPWCHLKRAGVLLLGIICLADAFQLSTVPTWHRFWGMLSVVMLLTGSAFSRSTNGKIRSKFRTRSETEVIKKAIF